MIEYSVVLKRNTSSPKPDTILFRDEDREVAISEMQKYCKKNGFTIYDKDGHYTISDIILIEQETIVGAPILSVTRYCDLFDVFGSRKWPRKPRRLRGQEGEEHDRTRNRAHLSRRSRRGESVGSD